MKIKILILFCLVSNLSFAQWQKPNNAYGTISNRANIKKVLMFPTGCGAPGSLSIPDSAQNSYAIYGDSCNDKAYLYNPKLKTWSVIGSGGSGTSGIDSTSLSINGDTTFFNMYQNSVLKYSYYWQGDGTGGGGSGNLPYNGDSSYYLGGDTLLHPVISPPSQINWSVLDSVNTVLSPNQGDIYLVSTSPTGTFSGHNNQIAQYDTTAGYSYNSANVGDLLYNAASQTVSKWTGTAWIQVIVDNYVHILYPETILGKKSFADTLNLLNKPIQIITQGNLPVELLHTRAAGVTYPWLSIRGTTSGSKITMGANNTASAADMLRIIADYSDSIWTGTYRPLYIDVYDYLDIRAKRNYFGSDSAIRFRTGNVYAGVINRAGKWAFNAYSGRNFYQNDTTSYKPLVIDNAGNIGQSSWLGVGGGSGSYHLPYNGISTNYLGGDTVYHALPVKVSTVTGELADNADPLNPVVSLPYKIIAGFLTSFLPDSTTVGFTSSLNTTGASWSLSRISAGRYILTSSSPLMDRSTVSNFMSVIPFKIRSVDARDSSIVGGSSVVNYILGRYLGDDTGINYEITTGNPTDGLQDGLIPNGFYIEIKIYPQPD